jgi:hypothetical protein
MCIRDRLVTVPVSDHGLRFPVLLPSEIGAS